jgi:hypothetical protein
MNQNASDTEASKRATAEPDALPALFGVLRKWEGCNSQLNGTQRWANPHEFCR